MSDSASFDLRGTLPSGITVLEASAGTGKTFTIAALAARFIAEGRQLHELLLVTFTRMATGELRERVRERLVSTEQELARSLAGAPVTAADEVAALLASGPRAEVEVRRERLARAIANFDAATIATTHGFCQEVLAELGTLGDLEPDVTFAEDVDDLVEEVIDDLYVRRFHREGGAPFDCAEAGLIARMAIENPTAAVHPLTADEKSIPAMRRRLALAARDELERRKRSLAVMTYDDLLTRLRDVLAGANGATAAARLQARYRVVLIDEFQDTDPVQWEIVERAFGDGGVTLVLIADPKQAIYAFRGADVYAYLAAVKGAETRPTLRVNWRSDQALIDAHDALFGEARLGHEGIAYRKVRAAPANQMPRLLGAPSPAALRVRIVDRGDASIKQTPGGFAQARSAREYVAKDVAADIVSLLSSGAEIEVRGDDSTALGRRSVAPGHVAVLVQSHNNAGLIQAELAAAGVPAVINGAGSVFGTPAARDWLHVLEALERPAYSARARSAALTPLLGWTAEEVALAGESDLEQLHRRLHAWARMLRLRGMAALAQTITVDEHMPRRVLAVADGERQLTDLQHIAQLLHGAATSEQLGTAALTSWLRERIASSKEEGNRDDLTRRLESDADAVQVLTIHRSKGLEFPVVYCPFLWEPGWIPDGARPVYFHDAEANDIRAIDVGLQGPEYAQHKAQYRSEERGEDLRMMYVALTRAKHQAVIWWAGSYNSRDSPLGRLLFAQDDDGNVRPDGSIRPTDDAVVARWGGLAEQAAGSISVERPTLGMPASWSGAPVTIQDLAAARFDRQLDARWRRTSYSDISAGAHDAMVGSEPEQDIVSDEADDVAAVGVGDEPFARARFPSLLGEMPVGLRIGTFVHSVLQATDFAAPDRRVELTEQIAAEQSRDHVEIGNPAAAAAGLAAAIETPFGAVDSGLGLRNLRRADRLDELQFELPLAGGDEPTGQLTLAAIARVLRSHLAPGDPLAGYAERLADPTLRRDVRGYLTGSIDLVFRVAGGGRAPRFGIADYKTNWLGGVDEELTAWHYRPEALAAEMALAHYGLQALLYTAALHRYLRWRMPGYDPHRNLAGVHYLFLRGMVGPDTPVLGGARCGVFSWHPPGALVRALSDVLDGSESA
ncbi:MAG: UvrD-helicase domain-containing protein [Actinomycetota bacterium]|nr:UvrD-helicase domain-containing protein [Actinomycetota bacterium]